MVKILGFVWPQNIPDQSAFRVSRARERKRLPGARVGTVDKFQGQEAPIAIYSTATVKLRRRPTRNGVLAQPQSAERCNLSGEVPVYSSERTGDKPNVAPKASAAGQHVLPISRSFGTDSTGILKVSRRNILEANCSDWEQYESKPYELP